MSKRQQNNSSNRGWLRNWPRWAPYAAIAWSLVYAMLTMYWAVNGNGFPYSAELASDFGPLAGRFGTGLAWTIVIIVGIPAAAIGMTMLRGMRLRPLLIAVGALVTGMLLLLMTDISLLIVLGYTPYAIVGLITNGEIGQFYLNAIRQWSFAYQIFCLLGGFLWLAATVSYARRSADACLYCGRSDGPQGWKSPARAAQWGRIAVYIAMAVPILYAFTRIIWALGIPLGISAEFIRRGQESGMWTSGLFLAGFGLVGAILTLGLTQRWGEVFPRWMIGLAGRHVPIALAVVPASIVSVLVVVGGLAMWSGLAQTVGQSVTGGEDSLGLFGLAPTALFPVWGVALAVATLGYYYRRRGPCAVCGRST